MAARLKEKYQKEIKQALQKELGLENAMAVPRLEKIVINMGLGEATQNSKLLDPLVADLAQIAGQKPVTTKAKKSIAAFKVRTGNAIGAMVTLRSDKAYEFLDRLISIALPRVRDFRGVSTKSFDGRGNYTLGLRDQLIFPEIDYAKVEKLKGMNITIVTTARTTTRRARCCATLECRSARARKTVRSSSSSGEAMNTENARTGNFEVLWQLLQKE